MKNTPSQRFSPQLKSLLEPQLIINIVYTLLTMFGLYYIGTLVSSFIASVIVIPGNIIGMLLLFILLELKVVNYQRIKKTGNFLLKHLSLFFIPFGVSILKYYNLFDGKALQFLLIIFISTILAFTFSALVVNKLSGGDIQ